MTDEAEILIKALRCKNDGPFKCLSCNAKEFCEGKNVADVSNIAAGLIDLQQAEIASYRQVRKALSDAGYSDLDTVFKALAQVKQERDVAVSVLGTICIDEGLCSGCKYDGVECDQDHCGKMGCWEWQGIDENGGKDDE